MARLKQQNPLIGGEFYRHREAFVCFGNGRTPRPIPLAPSFVSEFRHPKIRYTRGIDPRKREMAVKGIFYGYPVATLTTMNTTWQAALAAIATNQSYSLAGRSLTRANLKEVMELLAEIQSALDRANGTRVTQTYGFFNSNYPNCNTGTP